jgi:hypothetical protein
MLAFAGLNVVVAVMLTVARKRSGVFGLTPERKEWNEFMEAAKEKHCGKGDETMPEATLVCGSAPETTDAELNAILTVKPKNFDGIAR